MAVKNHGRFFGFLVGYVTDRLFAHPYLHTFLLSVGFKASKIDVSLFHYSQDSASLYLLVYVDDILVMGSDISLVNNLLSKLSIAFKIRDLCEPGFFLGIGMIKCDDGIMLSHKRYMTDILKRAGMAECKPLATPIPVSKYVLFNADLYDDPMQYRSLAGVLHKSALSTHRCSYNITLGSTKTCIEGGYPEDEYKALADVCVEVIWILSLLREINVPGIPVPKLWCDNLGATYMCASPIFHARNKHVEIDYHFVRDRVASGDIQVNFNSTKDQLANIFTSFI
ncbi:PREDICTED: uncharacterized protein LOC109159728 [Ipomoea nil]|uniref:uncharacterized protein LOC109159728 n=1 Tax=Ipomoea nil TaxID=35883 RepID=UPI000901DFD4|nr:PREDICTED: uncharacterized protein LOC109159728 [Ipomoea nil]